MELGREMNINIQKVALEAIEQVPRLKI